jgi:SAM-dependent methyltransferase
MAREKQRRDWEDLGRLDPLWAVLTTREGRRGQWGLDAFFATGFAEVGGLMATAQRLGLPAHRERALDFGCGAGRLTRALATHFHVVVGVDISFNMLQKAVELNREMPNCRFVLNAAPALGCLRDDAFDLVYTSIVLQHFPGQAAIVRAIGGLLQVLRPGGLLAFQLPGSIPLVNRIQPRRRLYRAFRALGIPPAVLYQRLRLDPIRMTALNEAVVRQCVARYGGRILEIVTEPHLGTRIESKVYYVTK